jgi:hypothetical protein
MSGTETVAKLLFEVNRSLYALDTAFTQRVREDQQKVQEIVNKQKWFTRMEAGVIGVFAGLSGAFALQDLNIAGKKPEDPSLPKILSALFTQMQTPTMTGFKAFNVEGENKRNFLEQNNAISLDMMRLLQQQKEQIMSLLQRIIEAKAHGGD